MTAGGTCNSSGLLGLGILLLAAWTALLAISCHYQCKMASEEEDVAEDSTSSPAAGTSQDPQAAPLEASEDPNHPVFRDTSNSEACASWCKHCFCFSCIQEWARREDVCPNCRHSVRHLFPTLRPHSCEVQDTPPDGNRGRFRRRSAGRRRRQSSGRQRHRSSSRVRGGGHAGAAAGGRSRSPRRNQDGHGRAQHTRGYNSSRNRRWQRSRARDTGFDDSRAPRHERDIPASSWRSQHHQRAGWHSSRDRHATRSRSRRRSRNTRGQAGWEHSQGHRSRERWRSRDRERSRSRAWERQWSRSRRRGQGGHRRSSSGTAAYRSPARQRQWRNRGRDEGRARRPQQDVPAYSGSSQARWRSRSTGSRARARRDRHRRRDQDQRRALSPQWEVPANSGRRERRWRGRRNSSREGRAARSRSQRRAR